MTSQLIHDWIAALPNPIMFTTMDIEGKTDEGLKVYDVVDFGAVDNELVFGCSDNALEIAEILSEYKYLQVTNVNVVFVGNCKDTDSLYSFDDIDFIRKHLQEIMEEADVCSRNDYTTGNPYYKEREDDT